MIGLVLLFALLLGALAGLWVLLVADLTRREMNTGARLAWLLLLLFAPILGFFIYYFTVVTPGIGVPKGANVQSGGLLVSNRGQVTFIAVSVLLAISLALLITPVSIELTPTVPRRIP